MEAVLDKVAYNNASAAPNASLTKVFSVSVEDNSNTATPTAATFTVTVVSTNDLPIVDMNGGSGNDNTISFTEVDGADNASAAVAWLPVEQTYLMQTLLI